MTLLSPSVIPLEPSSQLTNSHHAPPSTSYYPLASSSSSVTTASFAPTPAKPRYFLNPWPSYRVASLSDAYRAYQLGAAIAHPQPRTPSRPRTPATGLSRTGSSATLDEEEPYISSSVSESDVEDTDTSANAALLRIPPSAWYPARIYARKDLAEMYQDDEEDDWRDPPVTVVPPSWTGEEGPIDKEAVTWLGHAGVLVRIPWKGKGRDGMCGVLFDPIFSYRCSPSQYVGPARYLDAPCPVSMLPDIHVCCISHDHYDHLDYYTILDLWKFHKNTIHFFVPLGLKPWFISSGIPSERVTQLDWYHESLLHFPSSPHTPYSDNPAISRHPPAPVVPNSESEASSDLTLKVAFTPAQHRSGRGLLDHMTTLWGSWCVGVVEKEDEGRAGELGMRGWKGFKVFFGGDTGYRYATAPEGDPDAVCPAFEEIASAYSPFSLSLLPLSTGSSLPFLRNLLSLSLDQYTLTSSLHCSPADSLEIHRILGSKNTVGIHWGTFCDQHEARGTRVEFGRARRQRGIDGRWRGRKLVDGLDIPGTDAEEGSKGTREVKHGDNGRFVICDIGETLVLPE